MGDRVERGIELLVKLSRVKAVATDLDGTLTVDRRSYTLPVEAIEAVRSLRKAGVKVILVTANGFPIAMALAKYVGFDGIVAENGCVIAHPEPLYPLRMRRLCSDNLRDLVREVSGAFSDDVIESWQNDFRLCDFAIVTRRKGEPHEPVIRRIRAYLEDKGLAGRVKLVSSGYAIHFAPAHCCKLRGLRELLSEMGISLEHVVGVGDSSLDLEFVTGTGVSVAVSNADEELKSRVDIITESPSGQGFSELARLILDARTVFAGGGEATSQSKGE